MRTGVIAYVMEKNFPFEKEPELAMEIKRHYQADEVQIVSWGQRHFDIMDAWWLLTARGMQRFVCVFAGYGGRGGREKHCGHLRVCK
jgi:hypothetical protein